jgi:hypothetical protein
MRIVLTRPCDLRSSRLYRARRRPSEYASFATPMMALYAISIGMARLAGADGERAKSRRAQTQQFFYPH